jgi:formylglycine-generating enzyme required for sulfatase activity
MKNDYGKLLFILSLFLTRPSAKADLLDIYARLQGECNPAAQKFSVTNATWKVNAYNAYTADNLSGGGQCLVKCDINGNGKPDYIMMGPGIMNRSATAVFIALDLPDLKSLATAPKLTLEGFVPEIPQQAITPLQPNVIKCGDVNGDGIDDIVLGCPIGGSNGEGCVAVFFGAKSLAQNGIIEPKTWKPTIISAKGWSGANSREFFGKELELVDFNNDGILDIWTSAYGNPRYKNTFGRVLLIPGRTNWKTLEDAEDAASLSIGGSQVTDHIGVHLAVGDLNRDGKPDLIFSSPYHPGPGSESGKIWIIWGGRTYPKDFGGLQPGSILDKLKEFPLEPFGLSSISTTTQGAGMMYVSTGDFDGDGCLDLIVGSARYGEGKVDVLYGPLTAGTNYVFEQIQNRTTVVPSEMPEFISAQFGGSLLAGDIDGDGCADLLVGAKGFSQYKTGSRTGEGGAFLFSGSKRRPRYIQTGDSVARFLFKAGHNIEGGLGLAYVVSNQKPWICVADPAQGETYGFTFDNLPFIPVRETYSYSSTTNIQWKITSTIKPFNIPASLTNTANPYADILAALTNANVQCWKASVQKVDTDILQNNKIVANVYIKTEPIPDRIAAVWGQIRRILQKNNIPKRDLLLVASASYNNMSIKHLFGRTGWPGFEEIGGEKRMGGWIDNRGVSSMYDNIPIAFTSIHTRNPTSTEIANGVVAPLFSVTGDIYLLPKSLEQGVQPEIYDFDTKITGAIYDQQVISPFGCFPTVRLDFLDKYQNVLFSSSFYCPADAFGVNVPVNNPSNGLYFDQSEHYGSQLLFPGYTSQGWDTCRFLQHTLEMPFSVLSKIAEIRCELTTQMGPRVPSVGSQKLYEVTPRRLIVGLSEFSNYEYVHSTEQSPCVYQNLEVAANSRVALEVLATQTTFWEDMNYQWFVNGKLIPGATNRKQDFLIAQAADYGLYTCEIRYSAGASKLLVATVTASTPPAFIVQPESANLTPGDSIMLKTEVGGTKPIRLQWYKNGSAIPGATNSFLAIAPTSVADSGTYSVQGQNSVGTSTSQKSTVLVDATPKAPIILIQPDSLSTTLGEVVTFSVLAKGFPVPAYQWSKDSTPIAGATNSSLLIAAVTATDYGSYNVTVKNSAGSSTSQAALLGGNAVVPSIVAQPQSVTVTVGQVAVLSVSVAGSTPLGYQWQRNGMNLEGANASTLTINNAQLADAGDFRVVVINTAGSLTSIVAKLTVNLAPINGSDGFRWIPSGTFLMGSPSTEVGRKDNEVQHTVTLKQGFWLSDHETTQAEFKAVMGYNPSIFKFGGDNLPVDWVSWDEAVTYCQKLTERERSAGRITAQQTYRLPTEAEWEYAARAGTTGARYGDLAAIAWYDRNAGFTSQAVKGKQPNAWGLYDMMGNVWEWCSDWYGDYPTESVIDPIGKESGSQRVYRGGSFYCDGDCSNFSRSAKRGGSVYNLRNVDIGFRAVLSSVPKIGPEITLQPQTVTVTAGQMTVFSVAATGEGLSYQWQRNGANLAGAIASTLTINSAQVSDAGDIQVVVSNPVGSVKSVVAKLTVNPLPVAPLITSQPQSVTVMSGQIATFTVTAGGTGLLNYQWQRNGVNLPGATETTLNLSGARATDAGEYQVVVSNPAGSVTSAVAKLYVNESQTVSGASAVAVVRGGFVVAVIVTGGGYGYSAEPTVTLVGGGGVGATAKAVIKNGRVIEVIVLSAGSQYTAIPTVHISHPPIQDASLSLRMVAAVAMEGFLEGARIVDWASDLGGPWLPWTNGVGDLSQKEWIDFDGTGRMFRIRPTGVARIAIAEANIRGGYVTSVVVKDSGSGYGVAPMVKLSEGGGSGATALAILEGDKVGWVAVVNAGHGYETAPKVTIAPPAEALILSHRWVPVVEANGLQATGAQLEVADTILGPWRAWTNGLAKPDGAMKADLTPGATNRFYRLGGDQIPKGLVGFVWIAPGTFTMGSPENELGRSQTKELQHPVILSQGFWLSEHEVTQAEYEAVIGFNPSQFKGDMNRPVEAVSWDDAVLYCQKLTNRERAAGRITSQQAYRLPTEAEWEYAARAGTTGVRYGDLDATLWWSGNSGNQTHAVKQKAANAWGLYDIMGNVWEWCGDWCGDYPTGSVTDPVGPSSGSDRVVRGGGANNDAVIVRSASRYGVGPGNRSSMIGFRSVLSSVRPALVAPTIVAQPQSVTVSGGLVAVFTVTATGTGPLSHQWQRNEVNVAGATAPTLTINNAQTADAGDYRVVVNNSAGTVTSSVAKLTVN